MGISSTITGSSGIFLPDDDPRDYHLSCGQMNVRAYVLACLATIHRIADFGRRSVVSRPALAFSIRVVSLDSVVGDRMIHDPVPGMSDDSGSDLSSHSPLMVLQSAR